MNSVPVCAEITSHETPSICGLVLVALISPLFASDNHQDLSSVRTQEDWTARRARVLEGFQEATGPLPSRSNLPPLDVRTTESVFGEGYTRLTIDYVSEPGMRATAYLYMPAGLKPGEKRAGVVALHPTGPLGKGIVDGQGPRANRAYGKELAQRGYVVIAPDYVSFGGLTDYNFAQDRYSSGTMKGIWDHMRAVDVLQGLAQVDGERIGAIGHSLGGHNAIFFSVFDERVKVIVSSCGWTPLHDYYGGNLKGWTSDRYIPSIASIYQLNPDRVPFDYYGLLAALAPRGFYSNSPLRDSNFDYRGVEKAAPQVRRIYELLGAHDHLRISYPNADHDFPPAEREESYAFMDRFLR